MNRFISLAIFVAVLVIGWTGIWFYAANRVSLEAEAFFTSSSNTDKELDCEQFEVTGFPFRFDITCTNLTFHQLDLTLKAPEFRASFVVYRPTSLVLSAKSPLEITDNFFGSNRTLHWDDLRAGIRTNGWALARLSLQANNLQLFDNLIGQTLIANAEQIELQLTENEAAEETQTDLMQFFATAKIQNASAPEFDMQNGNLSFDVILSSMPDDLRQWSPSLIANNWFEHQTGVEVKQLNGQDDKSSFAINGRFSTTAQSMLTGNFDFFSTNFARRFNSLLDQNSLQVVFGSQSQDGSHYQSYALVHGVLLAGNLPVVTFGPMR